MTIRGEEGGREGECRVVELKISVIQLLSQFVDVLNAAAVTASWQPESVTGTA